MRLRVTAESLDPASVRIWLDDLEITKSCMGARIDYAFDSVTQASITIAPDEIDIDDAAVAILLEARKKMTAKERRAADHVQLHRLGEKPE